MRPRRRILLVGTDANQSSVLAYMLEVNRYRALRAENVDEAIKVFRTGYPDLVVALDTGTGFETVDRLKQLAAHVPMIVNGDPSLNSNPGHTANLVVNFDSILKITLLDWIKVMTRRKRGPRKVTFQPEV